MESNHISWLNYAVSDKAGETISVLQPGTAGAGNWSAAGLTESADHIHAVFRSYREE